MHTPGHKYGLDLYLQNDTMGYDNFGTSDTTSYSMPKQPL